MNVRGAAFSVVLAALLAANTASAAGGTRSDSAQAAGAASAPAIQPALNSRQQLDALDPKVRQTVKARVVKGEKVDDVVRTLILNDAALRYPGAKFYDVLPRTGTVLVAMPDNTMEAVEYDPATLKLKR